MRNVKKATLSDSSHPFWDIRCVSRHFLLSDYYQLSPMHSFSSFFLLEFIYVWNDWFFSRLPINYFTFLSKLPCRLPLNHYPILFPNIHTHTHLHTKNPRTQIATNFIQHIVPKPQYLLTFFFLVLPSPVFDVYLSSRNVLVPSWFLICLVVSRLVSPVMCCSTKQRKNNYVCGMQSAHFWPCICFASHVTTSVWLVINTR